MSQQIPESDWKVLRELEPVLLERFCKRALAYITEAANDSAQTRHQGFLQIFQLTQKQNNDLALAFDDIRRSNALPKLMAMRSLGLLTDEEFMRFRPDTRSLIDESVSIRERAHYEENI